MFIDSMSNGGVYPLRAAGIVVILMVVASVLARLQ